MKLFCESNENRNGNLKVMQRIEWPLLSDIDIARGDHTEWSDGIPDTRLHTKENTDNVFTNKLWMMSTDIQQ